MNAPLNELAQPRYDRNLALSTNEGGSGPSQMGYSPSQGGLASLSSPSNNNPSAGMSKGMIGGLSLVGRTAVQQMGLDPAIGSAIGPALSAINGDLEGAGQQVAGTLANYALSEVGVPGYAIGPAVAGLMGVIGDKSAGQIAENVANSALGSLAGVALGPLGGLAYSIGRALGFNPAQGLGEMMGMYSDLTPGYGGGFFGVQGIGEGVGLSAGEGVGGGISVPGQGIVGGGYQGAGPLGDGPQEGGVGVSIGPTHGYGIGYDIGYGTYGPSGDGPDGGDYGSSFGDSSSGSGPSGGDGYGGGPTGASSPNGGPGPSGGESSGPSGGDSSSSGGGPSGGDSSGGGE